MDRDIAILNYESDALNAAEQAVGDLGKANDANAERLKQVSNRITKIYQQSGKRPPTFKRHDPVSEAVGSQVTTSRLDTQMSYEELYNVALASLSKRGLDADSLTYEDLLTQAELDSIATELDRPISEREKWGKGDFVAVFIAALLGVIADVVLGNRNNALTGKDTDFSKWLDGFHVHEGGAPIDYQGPGFGGGYHRVLSKEHDILRFVEGIQSFHEGKFVGIKYDADGVAHKIVSYVNQNGKPYEQLPIIEAIVRYAKHMFADLLSKNSLPFPGSSFLIEANSQELRTFAVDMYTNGFNLKNIITQSLSTSIIEIIVRIYFSIQSVQKYRRQVSIAEDYSNWETIKAFFKPADKDKLMEMLLVSHAIVTAVNVGKVVIKEAPWEVNITEISSVIKYGITVVKNSRKRNSEYAKLLRNCNEISQGWECLEKEICSYEENTINGMELLVV